MELDAHLLRVALVPVVAVEAAARALDEAAHDGGVAEAEEQQRLGGEAVAALRPVSW